MVKLIANAHLSFKEGRVQPGQEIPPSAHQFRQLPEFVRAGRISVQGGEATLRVGYAASQVLEGTRVPAGCGHPVMAKWPKRLLANLFGRCQMVAEGVTQPVAAALCEAAERGKLKLTILHIHGPKPLTVEEFGRMGVPPFLAEMRAAHEAALAEQGIVPYGNKPLEEFKGSAPPAPAPAPSPAGEQPPSEAPPDPPQEPSAPPAPAPAPAGHRRKGRSH